MQITFTVRGKPTAQGRHRTFMMKRKGGGPDVRINTDPHAQAKNDFLTMAHANAPDVPWSGPLLVFLKCVFPRPKKHFFTGKRADVMRPEAPLFCPSKKNDFDNLAKFVCDSLNHIFYEDDGQIVFGTVLKMYGKIPRTEFTLRTIDEQYWMPVAETWGMEQLMTNMLDKPDEDDRTQNGLCSEELLFSERT